MESKDSDYYQVGCILYDLKSLRNKCDYEDVLNLGMSISKKAGKAIKNAEYVIQTLNSKNN
ncbi:hypothetical protein MsAg5_05920 [Methanosarcinaceae archaeon Ag5]|uniref:Uncharacterized protein n=1 Tax=Methanolapillus africanus TaxID=3028297 RepID=A0AAE4SEW7_9EURY|nr:hypothetical protein [Methanosarcinaceae archaeon Ag5]